MVAGLPRLSGVIDSVDTSKYGTNGYEVIMDIDNQADTSNYVYDAIGNLIQDKAEGITSIKWNVYGKITEINRTASAKVPFTKITYAYDAQGNRISKIATQNTGRMDYTWYVRDAQGNLITTYFTNDPTGANKDSLQKLGNVMGFGEQQIYGSSRLGMKGNIGNSVGNGPLDLQYFGYNGGNFYRGLLQYELTNHLGNVLSTISDKKIGVSSGGVGAAIDYYEPDIISANDYYPFGMLSRVALSTTSNHYRYGFNGKENDWEAKGWQNQMDYGERVYDPRIGRLLSTDPLEHSFPWYTPYQYAGNSPIANIDLLGAQPRPVIRATITPRARRPALSNTFVDEHGNLRSGSPVGPRNSPETPPYSGAVRVPNGWYVETPNGGFTIPDQSPFGPAAPKLKDPGELMHDDFIIVSNQLQINATTDKITTVNNRFEIITRGENLPDWYVQEVRTRLLSGKGTANDWGYKDELVKRGVLSSRFGEAQQYGKSASGTTLGQNLERAGRVRPLVAHAAHHIVAGTDDRAWQARLILQREGIDINDADNGVFLEGSFHRKLHTNAYYRKVLDRLSAAKPGTVRQELNKIAKEISAGTF